MSDKLKSLVVEIISALLILLFIYAAISKLTGFDEFKLQLSKSPFTTSHAAMLAWLVPAVEIAISILLMLPLSRLAGLYGSIFLLTLFSSYIVVIMNFSYYIPCSCGGVLATLSWKQHLILNLFFLALSIAGILLNENTSKALVLLADYKSIQQKNYLQIKE